MGTAPALSQNLDPLKKWLHDANNRVGAILGTAELLQFDTLSPQAETRRRVIEDQAAEMRDILRAISDHYFS